MWGHQKHPQITVDVTQDVQSLGTVKVEDFSVDFDVDSSPNCDVIFEVKNRGKGIIMESFA